MCGPVPTRTLPGLFGRHDDGDGDQHTTKKKSRFALSSMVKAGTKSQIGRLRFEHMTNVREGVNEREFSCDYEANTGDVSQLQFRVDELSKDPSDKKTRKHRDDWLHALNLAVTKRHMAGKARRRAVALLTNQLEREKDAFGDLPTVVDPSSFFEFGFSRDERLWQDHPLMSSDRELREGKKTFCLEAQFTDVDALPLRRPALL